MNERTLLNNGMLSYNQVKLIRLFNVSTMSSMGSFLFAPTP